MLNIGVLVSGGGTNLQTIIDNINSGELPGCIITSVISSRADAYAIKRAENVNIPTICISKKNYSSIEEYDEALIKQFEKANVDLVVMAGFLSIVGEKFISRFSGKIMNVHPSLIPAFCGKGFYGLKPHEKALEYGVKVTGATVHFVELETDTGPIILQKAVYVEDNDTPETLQKRVMEEAEWKILTRAIKLFAEGRLVIEGRRVKTIKRGHSYEAENRKQR